MGVSGPRSCFALVHSAERLHRGRVGVSLALARAAGSCLFPQPGNPLTFRRGEEPRTPLTPAASGRGGRGDRPAAPGELAAPVPGSHLYQCGDRTWRDHPGWDSPVKPAPRGQRDAQGAKCGCRDADPQLPPERWQLLPRGSSAGDGFQSILPSRCWEPALLGVGSTALTRIWVIAFQHSGLGAKIEVNHTWPGATVRKACGGAGGKCRSWGTQGAACAPPLLHSGWLGSPWSLPGLLLPLRRWTPRKDQQWSWDGTGAPRCSEPHAWGPTGALRILGGGL